MCTSHVILYIQVHGPLLSCRVHHGRHPLLCEHYITHCLYDVIITSSPTGCHHYIITHWQYEGNLGDCQYLYIDLVLIFSLSIVSKSRDYHMMYGLYHVTPLSGVHEALPPPGATQTSWNAGWSTRHVVVGSSDNPHCWVPAGAPAPSPPPTMVTTGISCHGDTVTLSLSLSQVRATEP